MPDPDASSSIEKIHRRKFRFCVMSPAALPYHAEFMTHINRRMSAPLVIAKRHHGRQRLAAQVYPRAGVTSLPKPGGQDSLGIRCRQRRQFIKPGVSYLAQDSTGRQGIPYFPARPARRSGHVCRLQTCGTRFLKPNPCDSLRAESMGRTILLWLVPETILRVKKPETPRCPHHRCR